MEVIKEFFRELDRRWNAEPDGKTGLQIIGSAALFLQVDHERGTKDSDILETNEITSEVKNKLLKIGGKDSDLHKRYRVYLDVVGKGIPFLPQKPLFHPLTAINRVLKNFKIDVLDVTDVVVSKLKRFNANDVEDIAAMADKGKVLHKRLVGRFESAVDVYSTDARAEDLPRYAKNLNTVERDFLRVKESKVELPEWAG